MSDSPGYLSETTYPVDKKEEANIGLRDTDSDSDLNNASFSALIAEDHSHEIQLRTMSWQKAAWLLCGDQVCLAIMAQSWSLSVLGWVPGLITMFLSGAFFWITSITMHKYIMKNPHIKDICEFHFLNRTFNNLTRTGDFGASIFGGSRIAYEFSGFMLLANNIILIGFHTLTAAKIFNTLSDHSQCTVIFSVIATLMGIVMSVPRTLRQVSFMSIGSSIAMGVAILLFLVFVGIENHPGYGYLGTWPKAGPVKTYAFPLPGTTWVDCMNAVLNITFLWVPQILFPTFIAEMEKPEDFPKSLAVLAAISGVLFIVPPSIGFHYLGQYATAPAFGSLSVVKYKKASFAFVIVPTMVIRYV